MFLLFLIGYFQIFSGSSGSMLVFRGCNHITDPIIEVGYWLFEGQSQLTLVQKENEVIPFIKSALNMFQTVILNMDKHCAWATYFWCTKSCQHQLTHFWISYELQLVQKVCRWILLLEAFWSSQSGRNIKVLIQVADSCSSQRRWLPFLSASHHPGENGKRRARYV